MESAKYEVKITETSMELTKRDRLRYKDLSTAIPLDAACDDDAEFIIVNPVGYVRLAVHNDKAKERKDYNKFVVVDKNGSSYVTGSESFIRSFLEIFEEMGADEYSVVVKKYESNNYKGKSFIKCNIL